MPEFRCTRRSPYSNPNCPGHADTRCRQGYYIEAPTAYDALREMRRDFPRDPLGFDIEEVKDQEPATEPHDDTQCPICGAQNGTGDICPGCQGELDDIISDAAANPIEVEIKK
jgi:hypothetical protein